MRRAPAAVVLATLAVLLALAGCAGMPDRRPGRGDRVRRAHPVRPGRAVHRPAAATGGRLAAGGRARLPRRDAGLAVADHDGEGVPHDRRGRRLAPAGVDDHLRDPAEPPRRGPATSSSRSPTPTTSTAAAPGRASSRPGSGRSPSRWSTRTASGASAPPERADRAGELVRRRATARSRSTSSTRPRRSSSPEPIFVPARRPARLHADRVAADGARARPRRRSSRASCRPDSTSRSASPSPTTGSPTSCSPATPASSRPAPSS